MTTKRKHLLDEKPMLVLPSLAECLGLTNAIVIQQLHFKLVGTKEHKTEKNFAKGEYWVYNSYRQWREDCFTWWSEATIQRAFADLEALGLVIADVLNPNPSIRSKWYRIDYEAYDAFMDLWIELDQPTTNERKEYAVFEEQWKARKTTIAKCDDGVDHHSNLLRPPSQNAMIKDTIAKCDDDYTENTETTTENTPQPLAPAARVEVSEIHEVHQEAENVPALALQSGTPTSEKITPDGKTADPIVLQMNVDNLVLAWLDELNTFRRKPSGDLSAIKRKARKDAEPLILDGYTAADVRAYVFYCYNNTKDTYWQTRAGFIPLSIVAQRLPGWKASLVPQASPPETVIDPDDVIRIDANTYVKSIYRKPTSGSDKAVEDVA